MAANLQEIKRTLEIFKPDDIIEVRAFGSKNAVYSGYFKNHDKLIEQISRYPNETFYFVMNKIDNACYSRDQCEKIVLNPKLSTKDKDISKIDWILIDVDPRRISGVSASDDEKAKSKVIIGRIYNFLNEKGFEKPIIGDSGNGYHLLYKTAAENTDSVEALIKKF